MYPFLTGYENLIHFARMVKGSAAADNVSSVVILFTIIVAGGIVASEFSWGTVKLLTIRPASRMEVLLSEYAAVLLYALMMLAVLLVASLTVGGLFFGFSGQEGASFWTLTSGETETNAFFYIMRQYSFVSIPLVMMATFAFMISALFRNSALAIGLSIFLYLTGSVFVEAFSQYRWTKYILFANTDLRPYFEGTAHMAGGTLSFSITTLLVLFYRFLGFGFWVVAALAYTKRDIAV